MGDVPASKRTAVAMAVLLGVYLFFTLLYGRFVIQNDGISYYSMALSLVRDFDFDLRNQYEKYDEIRMVTSRYTRRPASYYSCGFGILYAPFLYGMEIVESAIPSMRAWRPYPQNTKFPAAHGIAILLGSFVYGLGSVLLGCFLLTRHYNASPWIAMFLAVAVFIGTPLICYAYTIPSFTHASDTFLVALAFCLAVSSREFRLAGIRWRNVLLGFSLALSVMLRNNNVVIVPVLVLGLLFLERKAGWKNALRTCVEVLAGALPIIVALAHFNYTQYGKIIASGYTVMGVSEETMEQGATNSYDILFHPVVGVYVWSPVSLLATAGLFYGAWKRRKEAVLALLVAIIVIVSICFTAVIWPGSSFGQRLLTHLYICWVVGLFEFYTLLKKPALALTAVAALWAFLLFNFYFVIVASPTARKALFQNQDEYTPANMIRTAASEYREAHKNGNAATPLHYWYTALCTRPYPTLQHILLQ